MDAGNNSYAQWRLRHVAVTRLNDGHDAPPERLLQTIWQHQRLRRDRLKTFDGQSVRIIHPGFGNPGGGPDFRDALVQIGDTPPQSGDVEIDLRPGGWHSHGHAQNPTFRNVILHVVWDGEPRPGAKLPLLALCQSLDAPVGELSQWLEREPVQSLPGQFQGKCSAPLRELNGGQVEQLLRQAAGTRLRAKAASFSARARHAGWEQALWEGLFRALGYKRNTWPMHCLAEARGSWTKSADSAFALQARLLGIGGLLPDEVNRRNNGGYLRRAWDSWWRERDEFEACLLPRASWKFNGLRPANHPQRRLALASHWLAAGNLVSQLERWCADIPPEARLLPSLTHILQVSRDDYWSWHWTLRSARLARPQPLLGEKRVTDLAINVVLPWLWTRATEGGNHELQNEIERRYFAWPSAEDNAVLRLARQRLLGIARKLPPGAAAQQGLMQIVRDFCDHSNAACDCCQFPELVKQLLPIASDKT